jgi:hypothetical protein
MIVLFDFRLHSIRGVIRIDANTNDEPGVERIVQKDTMTELRASAWGNTDRYYAADSLRAVDRAGEHAGPERSLLSPSQLG